MNNSGAMFVFLYRGARFFVAFLLTWAISAGALAAPRTRSVRFLPGLQGRTGLLSPSAALDSDSYAPDCNDPDAHDLNCAEPARALIEDARAAGYPYYVGHAEPTALFFSRAGTSGSDMQWKFQLPATEPNPTQNGSDVSNFELYSTFWIGLALCDPNSFPFGTCVAVSDTNNPATAGAAFLELQFYPPGLNCSNTQWCVRLHINTFENATTTQKTNCLEPTTAQYVTTNGTVGGPKLLMNNGDSILVTIHDTANGIETDVNDVTTSTTGSMVASGANGFLHNANQTDCTTAAFDFHAMYATASPGQVVPWLVLKGNVSFDFEIAHWELCGDSACNTLPDSGDEGTCNISTSTLCKSDANCPTGETCNVQTKANCTTVRGVGGCFDTDLDHDGTSYLADWPDGSAAHPASVVLGSPDDKGVGPLSKATTSNYDEGYNTIKFMTTEGTTGAFYPFFSQAGTGAGCRFNFGNDLAGTTNDFGKAAQYGTTIDNPCLPGTFDYSLSALPLDGGTLLRGESTQYTVTATLLSGTAVSVALSSDSTKIPTGATDSFSPSSVTPTIDGATSTYSLTTSTTGGIGAWTLQIDGLGGGLSRTISPLVTVETYDFTVGVSPSDRTVLRGGSTSYGLTLTRLPNTVLSAPFSIPSISLAALALPGDATASFSPSSVMPTLAGATSTLTVGSGAPPGGSLGDFSFTVKGSDGNGGSRTGSANLHLYDFALTALPATLDVLTTGTGSYSVTTGLASGSSTTGVPAIGLTVAGLPSGATGIFNPVSGTPTFASTLGITTVNSPSGTDTLTITGTDSRSPEGGSRNTKPTLVVLTPAQALQLIENQIQNLQSTGVLNGGQANSLLVKLEAAISQLNASMPGTACNQLTAFVNEVNAYVSAGILTQAQADLLLDGPLGVIAIMAAIPC